MAVNATFSVAEYCAADTVCAECEGGPIDEGISTRCNQERGKCVRVMPE